VKWSEEKCSVGKGKIGVQWEGYIWVVKWWEAKDCYNKRVCNMVGKTLETIYSTFFTWCCIPYVQFWELYLSCVYCLCVLVVLYVYCTRCICCTLLCICLSYVYLLYLVCILLGVFVVSYVYFLYLLCVLVVHYVNFSKCICCTLCVLY
jgi:hypothetical protein